MNKRQTRLFAIGSTALATLVFLGMTVDSHRQFDKLTNVQDMTPEVINGKDVWHKYNCINCHTLFGEGAYYAPDLTKITQQRGSPYLTAYMKDPSKFYDEQKHRRLMPTQNLSDKEISNLISFLDWVSKVDNQGWPPRAILVSGASIPGTSLTLEQQAQAGGAPKEGVPSLPPGAKPVTPADNPIALGEALFRATPPACSACHSIAPGVNLVGPSLAGMSTRAETIINSPDYKGTAKDLESYIRESIVKPNAHIVPGPTYSANGQSFMPNTYEKDLTKEQIEQLTAYLATLK